MTQTNAVIKWRTHREAVRFTLEWTIEDFRTFRKETEIMYDAAVTMAALGMPVDYRGRWCLGVRPRYIRTENDTEQAFLSVFLKLSSIDNEADMNKELHVDKEAANESDKELDTSKKADKDSDMGNEYTSSASECTIPVKFLARITTGKTLEKEIWSDKDPDVYMYSSDAREWGWTATISHDNLFGAEKTRGSGAWLKDDCITVSLDVVVYKQSQSILIPETTFLNTSESHKNLATRQLNWFSSQQQRESRYLDFTLRSSDDKEFYTSRWMLMAHSPVFAAMLNQNSKESEISRCEMADIDGETTEIMLDYLYGCSLQKINKVNAEKVLIMADKYQIMDLLHACEELLASNVAVDEAVHLLVLASQRGLEKLKTAALNVVPKNMTTVLKNGALEEALQADPYLMQTIMEHCSKRMRVIDES